MKTFHQILCVIFIAFCFVSCDDEGANLNVVTEEEAAQAIENALSEDTEGMTAQATESARMADTYTDCSVTFDSTITESSTVGSITYDYTFNWNGELSCTNMIPSQLSLDYTMSGTYDSPRMSSSDNATGNITVTGLRPSESQYTLNGSYSRTGTQSSKIREQRNFSSTITVTATNWLVNKTTNQIDGGSATVLITGESSDGLAYSFTGTLTLLGNQEAVLDINGTEYPISW